MPSCTCATSRPQDCLVHQCEPCLGVTLRWQADGSFGPCSDCGTTGVEHNGRPDCMAEEYGGVCPDKIRGKPCPFEDSALAVRQLVLFEAAGKADPQP